MELPISGEPNSDAAHRTAIARGIATDPEARPEVLLSALLAESRARLAELERELLTLAQTATIREREVRALRRSEARQYFNSEYFEAQHVLALKARDEIVAALREELDIRDATQSTLLARIHTADAAARAALREAERAQLNAQAQRAATDRIQDENDQHVQIAEEAELRAVAAEARTQEMAGIHAELMQREAQATERAHHALQDAERLRKELREAHERATSLETQLTALLGSTSWKATRPLRRLADSLRSRAGVSGKPPG